jgi:hypothetical protein
MRLAALRGDQGQGSEQERSAAGSDVDTQEDSLP